MTADRPKSAAMTVEELVDFYGYDLEPITSEQLRASEQERAEELWALRELEGATNAR